MKKFKFLMWPILLLGLCCGGRFGLLFEPPTASFPLSPKWRVDLGSSTYDRPAYQDGLVLFPADTVFSSYWYGLNAATGQVAWSQRVNRNSFLRCLTREYLVVSGPYSISTLKPDTGEVIWDEEQSGLGGTCSETTVFFSGTRSSMSAVNISTGQLYWSGIKPRMPVGGLIYNPENGELIVNEGDYYIVDPKSGIVLRSFKNAGIPPEESRGPMYLVDRGQFFIGGTVLDVKTGQILHKENRYSGFASPTVTEDTIYISDSTENMGVAGVVALDRATYAVKWKYQPQYKMLGIPLFTPSPVTILDGVGYVIFSDATLRAFDLKTGQELGYWQPRALDVLFWPACVAVPVAGCVETSGIGMGTSKDSLFVSFGDGKLYAFGR